MAAVSEPMPYTQAQEPAEFRHVFKTRWIPADDAEQVNGQPLVEACVVEEEGLDAYGLVVSSQPVILHRVYDTKLRRMGRDVSATAVRADAMLDEKKGDDIVRAGLMTRFRTVISEYLQRLRQERRPIPIDFLGDRIPAVVVRAAKHIGLQTAEDFARSDAAAIERLQQVLRANKEDFYAHHVRTFRNRAADFTGSGVSEPEPPAEPVEPPAEDRPKARAVRPRRGRQRRPARR